MSDRRSAGHLGGVRWQVTHSAWTGGCDEREGGKGGGPGPEVVLEHLGGGDGVFQLDPQVLVLLRQAVRLEGRDSRERRCRDEREGEWGI